MSVENSGDPVVTVHAPCDVRWVGCGKCGRPILLTQVAHHAWHLICPEQVPA